MLKAWFNTVATENFSARVYDVIKRDFTSNAPSKDIAMKFGTAVLCIHYCKWVAHVNLLINGDDDDDGRCPRGSYAAVWSWKFKGFKFYRGLKFELHHWLCLWVLTQSSATVLPVIDRKLMGSHAVEMSNLALLPTRHCAALPSVFSLFFYSAFSNKYCFYCR